MPGDPAPQPQKDASSPLSFHSGAYPQRRRPLLPASNDTVTATESNEQQCICHSLSARDVTEHNRAQEGASLEHQPVGHEIAVKHHMVATALITCWNLTRVAREAMLTI